MADELNRGWIGVDLDGTLAEYMEWKGIEHIGAPIPKMVARVKRWLAEGKEVRIFTARIAPAADGRNVYETILYIMRWSVEVFGTALRVTCTKDHGMIELWDDRAVAVQQNTGEWARYCGAGKLKLSSDCER